MKSDLKESLMLISSIKELILPSTVDDISKREKSVKESNNEFGGWLSLIKEEEESNDSVGRLKNGCKKQWSNSDTMQAWYVIGLRLLASEVDFLFPFSNTFV